MKNYKIKQSSMALNYKQSKESKSVKFTFECSEVSNEPTKKKSLFREWVIIFFQLVKLILKCCYGK